MFHPRHQGLTLAAALCSPLVAVNAFAADPVPQSPAAPASAPAPARLDTVEVTGTRQRLDAARNGLSPDTGSTLYRFNRQDLDNLPQGEATPLNQVILQTPGVVQDSYGQLHVRGDHANVQYRINGVIIPEAISGFGQSLETRFADRISILTGALPAQYGYRTAAIVDIQAKTGKSAGSSAGKGADSGAEADNGGSIGYTIGSRGHEETTAELSGTKGKLSYYLTGSYLHDAVGIENPTPDRDAIHDTTKQVKGFGYLSYLLDDDSRVSLLFGTTNNGFQIPNLRGQSANYTLAAPDGTPQPTIASESLNASQRERNRFTVLTYQGTAGEQVDYQVSIFNRATDVHYHPDAIGDLQYDGIAADIRRKNVANGLQADASFRLNATHTLRGGVFAQHETFSVANAASVFPADADGNQTSTAPISIRDDTRLGGNLYGLYVQDEWQPIKPLTVNYGLRYDKVSTVSREQQWSPRLGLVFDATPTLRLHAGYSRYFTPPPTEKIDTTSVAQFANTTNALPSNADTSVRSERSNYYDTGLAWQATPQLTLGLDGYYRQVQHLQDEGQFGNALIYSAFNYAKGKIYGLEASATYKAGSFTGYLNFAAAAARGKGLETGQFNFPPDEIAYIANNWVHLDHEQKLTASAGASYRFGDRLTLSADALYGSGLRNGFANTAHLPAYTQVNVAAARSFDFGGSIGKLETRVSMLNLFDRTYQLRDGSGIGVGAPQFGPRRTLLVGLNKPF